ncbi:WD40 repeat-like protein [Auriscalpium vulgare]|uniref:WD40 repeat-like protein n=1 Tax=Auriscalpium vulgare TaxID=40419 RepID=A0ACB8RPL8_9AGAM|nr:WD40 repeat-like protein [Auriscalpium vulgare]
MTPRIMAHATTVSSRPRAAVTAGTRHRVDFATLGRTPLRLGLGSRRITSRELEIVEAADELLTVEIPDTPTAAGSDGEGGGPPSLLRGFQATIPSADKGRTRRRQTRNVEAPRMGMKRMSMGARGLMVEDAGAEGEGESEEDVVVVGKRGERERGKRGRKKRGRESLSAQKVFGREELERQTSEIKRDKENLHVRRSLIHNDIAEITHKIEALDIIRTKLEEDLLKLHEDDLELDDELEMVRERLELEESRTRGTKGSKGAAQVPPHLPPSRRRKGPAFLPSEHDELPPGMAFMTLECGSSPIAALDFSEPYGTLVTATQDDAQPRVWDLLSGEEIGRLRGHTGAVKAVQVEDAVCLTGSADGTVRVWDLRRVDAEADEWEHGMVHLSDVIEEAEEGEGEGEGVVVDASVAGSGAVRQGASKEEEDGPCVRVLEGHSKAVTAMYFEDETLVTGASDKTLRQWDLNTGQCVMTMDILWALSHPPSVPPGGALPGHLFSGAAAAAGAFAVPTPPYADGSWEMYQDFVGAVQFWGYALVSGSGDGAVRMWDMRTGQAHRTLLGHTGPVTCLQFDEIHVVSGSLDKSIRIWDLRTGGIFETVKYDHAVTSLQFDSRKIVSAAGENGVKVYNRTSMQHSTLLTNGHTKPVEKLSYMDRYLVSGARDAMVKIWAL